MSGAVSQRLLSAVLDEAREHGLVDALETSKGMAVHAYLHRKEGEAWNAEY